MGMQSATAILPSHDPNVEAVCVERAPRGVVKSTVQSILHTALQDTNGPTRCIQCAVGHCPRRFSVHGARGMSRGCHARYSSISSPESFSLGRCRKHGERKTQLARYAISSEMSDGPARETGSTKQSTTHEQHSAQRARPHDDQERPSEHARGTRLSGGFTGELQ